MPKNRTAIPTGLKRKLFQEAGYRCSIPTCRATTALEMEHIEDWSIVKEHQFDNMIILCANCHARVTTNEISKTAVRAYKQNLAVLAGRYSLFEMRLIEMLLPSLSFVGTVSFEISSSDKLHIRGLLHDGLIKIKKHKTVFCISSIDYTPMDISLTEEGKIFVSNYFGGVDLT